MNQTSILLVDDSDDDVELTLRAFRSYGATPEIHVARDGDEAIETLFGSTTTPPRRLPTLVLLDLKLPGLTGFEVLSRIRAHPRTRLVPVVILTHSTERTDLADAYGLGANSYVRKPVSFREFVDTAGLLARYWLVLNEVPEPARTITFKGPSEPQ
jgi:two-component system response regulator